MANRALNDEEVANEMKKMTEFIRQEAQEKAREIQVKADEEHNIEKAKLVRQETINIDALYQKKMKQAQVQKRIEQSNFVNKCRLKVLQTREEQLNELFNEAKNRLKVAIKDENQYKELLKHLLLQGLFQFLEKDVQLICRKQDVQVLEGLLPEVQREFEETVKYAVQITINQQKFLPDASAGGIVLSCLGGRVLSNNSLESRLELACETLLPAVRMMLFGTAPTRRFFD